jgi:lysophospholipase L1-like esterase
VKALLERGFVIATLAGFLCSSAALAAEAPDLSRLIVIGDSLSAGMQNMSLFYGAAYGDASPDGGQTKSYAHLVYRQATGRDLLLPAVALPGFPRPFSACRLPNGMPQILSPQPETRSPEQIHASRLIPYLPAQNFAVPGQKLHDLLYLRPSVNFSGLTQEQAGIQLLTNLVLGFPTYFFLNIPLSQLEMLEAMPFKPDTLFLWVGSNDGLEAVRYGDPRGLTPLKDFAKDFSTLMRRVGALRIPHVFMANLPDPTGTAFLIPVTELSAMGVPVPLGYPTEDGPLTAGDFLTLEGLGKLQLFFPGKPLPDSFVITAAERNAIRDRVMDYNTAIEEAVSQYNRTRSSAPVKMIDAWAQMNVVRDQGVTVGGIRLTTSLLGGLFSLDGVHPSNTGYAVIANWFVDAINDSLPANRRIPQVDINQVASADPLVPWNFGNLPACPPPPAQ